MTKMISRQTLYDLIWERPTRTIAAELGVSDVALAKACRRAEIPVPPRGYWARTPQAQRALKASLPPRFPGASERLFIGGKHYGYWPSHSDEELLNMEAPPVPTFDEPMEQVAARVQKMVGPVASVKNFDKAFGDISRLLAHDEERRKSQWSFDKPKYESGPQRRRLLILNSIFLALSRLGCRSSMNTSKYQIDDPRNRSICAHVGAQHIYFTLDAPDSDSRQRRIKSSDMRLSLSLNISGKDAAQQIWTDTAGRKIESQLRDIVVAILVDAERQHRDSASRIRDWIIERKENLVREIARRKEEEIRLEHERREKLEKARVNSLLQQAQDLQRATTIRKYVSAVRGRISGIPLDPEQFEVWARWALKVADRVDPSLNLGNFTASVSLEAGDQSDTGALEHFGNSD